MLRRYSRRRTLKENIKLAMLTAFTAGVVNVASLILFFSFTSNITGHYAILADEISNGNYFQILIVFVWILSFFAGSYFSGFFILKTSKKHRHIIHLLPLTIELTLLLLVGIYGDFFYQESLIETEVLVSMVLISMGLQNGLTATITNLSIKTSHLTGLTTDFAIHLAYLATGKKEYKGEVIGKIKLQSFIILSFMLGGIISGIYTHHLNFKVFYLISIIFFIVLISDYIYRLLKKRNKINGSKNLPRPIRK